MRQKQALYSCLFNSQTDRFPQQETCDKVNFKDLVTPQTFEISHYSTVALVLPISTAVSGVV